MEPSDILSFLPQGIRRHLVPLTLGVVGLLLIVIGSFPLIFSQNNESGEVIFEAGSESASNDGQSFGLAQDKSVLSSQDSIVSSARQAGMTIQVDVSGAVASPGVITLASDSRMQDAIKAAGGLAPEANNEWIAKNLNLATKLSDAAKIYIPFVGEEGIISGNNGDTHSASSGRAGTTGLININSASQAQLESLPGIGPVTAQKIIANRPYSVVSDLLTKKSVGQSVFEKIREQVTAN